MTAHKHQAAQVETRFRFKIGGEAIHIEIGMLMQNKQTTWF